MTNENGTTYSVLEDLLFARRLERTLRIQHERLNNLMKEQIELLERRQQLLALCIKQCGRSGNRIRRQNSPPHSPPRKRPKMGNEETFHELRVAYPGHPYVAVLGPGCLTGKFKMLKNPFIVAANDWRTGVSNRYIFSPTMTSRMRLRRSWPVGQLGGTPLRLAVTPICIA